MAGKLIMIKFIKMKKKIVFAVATGFFAVATVFNMNLLQGNSAGDVSLDAIAVMAQAQSEANTDQDTNYPGQTITKNITIETYRKWDAKAGFWIISSVGGEGYQKHTESYSYQCCFGSRGEGCIYSPC